MELTNTIASLKEDIDMKLSHPFLAKYIEKPVVDEDKLLLLYTLFQEADVQKNAINEYCMTAMLVQIALDTHDLVGNVKCKENTEFIGRQLTVLAGDYFSGLYYTILANLHDVKMIRIFADAIKEINEHKIRLYQSEHSFPDMIYSLSKIEGALFEQLGKHYHLQEVADLAMHFLTYKRLCHEKSLFDNGELSIFIKSLQGRISTEKEPIPVHLLSACQEWYQQTQLRLAKVRIHSIEVKELLHNRIHALSYTHETLLNNLVEEG